MDSLMEEPCVEEAPPGEVTKLLQNWESGDIELRAQVVTKLYTHLHQIASRLFKGEAIKLACQTTELMSELWIRLLKVTPVTFKNHQEFLQYAASLMRHAVIDLYRKNQAKRRGGGTEIYTLQEIDCPFYSPDHLEKAMLIKEVFGQLAQAHPKEAKCFELSFFMGFTHEEIGKIMNTSKTSIQRHLVFAKHYLASEMPEKRSDPGFCD